MKLPFKIALRFLTSSKAQTILITVGISIGVAVQIFIGSLIQGLQSSLIDTTIGHSSQITISSKKDGTLIHHFETKIADIKTFENRISNISPSAEGSAFLTYKNTSQPVLIKGLDFKLSEKLYGLNSRVISGSLPSTTSEVLMGKDLRDKLKVKTGDNIKLINSKGNDAVFKISGFYDFKVSNINKSWIISNLKASQNFFNMANSVSTIEIQTSKGLEFSADEIAADMAKNLNDSSLNIENWKVQNEQLLSGLMGQSMSSYMIQGFVLISVLLGIASVLAISVVQKSKQIGILKAMGIKNSTASLIFMFQGLMLGILGAVLGILLGIGLAVSFTKFAINKDGTPIVPLYLNNGFILFSGFMAIVSAALASVIPARNSSKLEPMEVIKNG